jgi:hypothetical protein
MRLVLTILVSFSLLTIRAQAPLPVSQMNYSRWQPMPYSAGPGGDSIVQQKWYFSKYAGLAIGYGFFNGGNATTWSLPVGLQLNHPLNNNLVAFVGVSAAPTFFYVHSLTNPILYKPAQSPYLSNMYSFGMDTRMEMGLMYTNDARTFSISGSIGIERYAYPVYPTERTNVKKP